jgi:hypothetical protein
LAVMTASSSTSQKSAILRLISGAGSGRSGRAGCRAGCRSRAGRARCAGSAWSSARRPLRCRARASGGCRACSRAPRPAGAGGWPRGTAGSRCRPPCRRSPPGRRRPLRRHRADGVLDLVGDVRDDLDGAPEVVAAPLLVDDREVDLAGGPVAVARGHHAGEPLVVPRSRSVSAPSSVTNTSPCWYGLIVPGSTLMYGSNFCSATR